MIETIKKNWFIVLIAILFLLAAVYFAIDMNKGKVSGKTVDGKDVVFEFNGKNFYADDLYTTLYKQYGVNTIVTFIQNEIFANAFEPDADMISEAKLQAESDIKYLKQYYGEEYETVLLEFLNSYGFSKAEDLQTYYLTVLMAQQIYRDYINEDFDTYYNPYAAEKSPRIVSHILIAMEDPANPTEEEQNKLDAAKAALAEPDADFATVAQEYSDDTNSAIKGGSLGIVDKDNVKQYVQEFQDTIFTIEDGATSEWIQTEYGMHIIKVVTADKEQLKEDETLYSLILNYHADLYGKIVWDQCQKQNISFSENKELEDSIKSLLGIKD